MSAQLYAGADGRPVMDFTTDDGPCVVATCRITEADGSPVSDEWLREFALDFVMAEVYGPAADSVGMGA